WSPDALGVAPAPAAAPVSYLMAPPSPSIGSASIWADGSDVCYVGDPDEAVSGIRPPRQWHEQTPASAPSRRNAKATGSGFFGTRSGHRSRPAAPPRRGPFWSERPGGTTPVPPDPSSGDSLAARVRDLLRAVGHPATDLA